MSLKGWFAMENNQTKWAWNLIINLQECKIHNLKCIFRWLIVLYIIILEMQQNNWCVSSNYIIIILPFWFILINFSLNFLSLWFLKSWLFLHLSLSFSIYQSSIINLLSVIKKNVSTSIIIQQNDSELIKIGQSNEFLRHSEEVSKAGELQIEMLASKMILLFNRTKGCGKISIKFWVYNILCGRCASN